MMQNSTSRSVTTELTREINEVMSAVKQKKASEVNGTPQWTLTKSDGAVVSKNRNNKTTVVKRFKYDTYAGPNTSDFIDRGRSIYQAAQYLLSRAMPLSDPRFSKMLDDMWHKLEQDLNAHCALDQNIMAKGDKTSELHFNEIYANAVALLATFRGNLCRILKDQPIYGNDNFEGESGLLRKTEINLIKDNGRPNVINLIDIDQNTQLISAQLTLGETTIPSSITTGGLRNFVKSAVAVAADGKTEIHDIDYRFGGGGSSIGIKDDEKRYKQNHENINELLRAIAADKFVENPMHGYSPEYPMTLKVFSLTLLTPFKETFERALNKIVDIPSEQVMMTDVEKVLAEFNVKRPFQLEIQTEEGPRTIWVKPHFSHVNIPTNISQMGPIDPHSIAVNDKQTEINNKGFNEYFSEMEGFILNNREKLTEEQRNISVTSNVFNDTKKRLEIKTASIAAIFSELNSYIGLINSRVKNETRGLTQIDKFKKIMEIRADIYKKNQHRFEELNSSIKMILSDPALRMNYFNTDQGRSLKKQLLAMQCYVNNQRLYFNDDKAGNYKLKENAFVLLANMHLSLFTANISHTSGCKSAKDRTGMLNIYKEAMAIFSTKYGFYPDPLDNGQARQLQIIINNIHYKVASMESAALNDPGAHGVQSTLPVDPNTGERPFSPSKPMGLLAKAPFKNMKVKRNLNLNENLDEYEQAKIKISHLVKNLRNAEDSNKLKELIDFDDKLLSHAIVTLETEIGELVSQKATHSKSIDIKETPEQIVIKKLLEELKIIAALKNHSFEVLKKRLIDELNNTSRSEKPPNPYAVSYLITKIVDPDEQESIRLLVDQLATKYPRLYDSCTETLLLQQAHTAGALNYLEKNLVDYTTLVKIYTGTHDQKLLLNKIRHESTLVTNVLASLESSDDDAVKSAESYLRLYRNALHTIIRENDTLQKESALEKRTDNTTQETGSITGRDRSISSAPRPLPYTSESILSPPSSPRSSEQESYAPADKHRVAKPRSPNRQRRWPSDESKSIAATPAPVNSSISTNNTLPVVTLPEPPKIDPDQYRALKAIAKSKLPPPPEPTVQNTNPLRFGQLINPRATQTESTAPAASGAAKLANSPKSSTS